MEKRFKHIVKVLLLMVMVIPAINLAGQSTFSVNIGTTDIYSITARPNINDYLWEAYSDANLTSPAAPADVSLTLLGAGRENEIEVAWNTIGTWYLAISVTDTEGCTNQMAWTFIVMANQPPVANNDTNQTIETTPVDQDDGSGNLLANDTDPESGELTVYSINGNTTGTVTGIYGTLVWYADGTYTYTPNAQMDTLYAGEFVVDSFTVRISDPLNLTATSTLTITISGINAEPLLANDTNETIETIAVTESSPSSSGNLLANDTDIDGETLTIESIDGNTSGTLAGIYGTLYWNADGTYTYVPNAEMDTLTAVEYVNEEFTYTASDGSGGSSTATLTITIYGENNPPVALDDTNETVETTPVDETDGSGNLLANDTDPDGDPLSIAIINGDNTGTVAGIFGTLYWNADGTYTYVPNAELDTLAGNESVFDIFQVTVSDGNGGTSTSTLTITINGQNEPPVATDDTNETIETISVNETDGSGNILANDTDPDSDPLIVASVNGDGTGTIAGNYGILEWNPDGTYIYTPNPGLDSLQAGDWVDDVFTVTVSDGNGGIATSTLTITIYGENDPPVALNDTNETIETTPVDETDGSGNLLANDIDPDGDVLIVDSINGDVSGTVIGIFGTLEWNTDGTYTYTPNPELDSLNTDENVFDIFQVTVSDGNGGTSISTLTITIEGRDENLPPIAETDYITVEEDDVEFPVNVLNNDYDPNGDNLTVSLVTLPVSEGVVSVINNIIYYTPPANFFGEDYFLYEICDDGIPSLCDIDTVFITVTPVNDPPVANTDYGNIPANSSDPVIVDILENDYDPEGDELTASIVSGPTMGGTVTLGTDGTVSYIPPTGFVGIDTIIYQICDNGIPSLCDTDTIFIDVFDRIEAVDDYYSMYAGEQDTFIILDNDLYFGLINVTVIDGFDRGTFELNTDGSITYIAPNDYVGNDTLTYVISNGTDTDTAIVVVTINPRIEMLVQASCSGETPIIMWNVSIAGVTVNTIDLVLYNASGETVQVMDDSPLDSWIEWPGVSVDEYGLASVPEVLLRTLTIEAEYSQAPFSEKNEVTIGYPDCHTNIVVAVWDTFTVRTSTIVLDVLENDYDPDEGEIDPYSLAVQDTLPYWKAQHGYAIPNGNGKITYIPDPGYSGTDSFVYVICDDWTPQIACDTAIVWLNVFWDPHMIAVDDEYWTYMNNPIIMSVFSNDIDPSDGLDLSSVQLLSDPENGNAFVNPNGTITYIPLNGFVGVDSLSYIICNSDIPQECDSAWVYIRVVVNNGVLAVHDDTLTNAGEPVEILVLENDIDPENQLDSTSIAITYRPEYGTVTITDNHTVWYDPQPGFAGLDSFIYRVCDLGFPTACDTAVVFITVIDNNVALVANPDDTITGENIEVVIPVLVNDYDPDGYIDTTSIAIVENPENGSVSINPDGTLTYMPANGFNGVDTFIYRLCDNGPVIACDTALVTVTVVENLPPVAFNDTINAVNGEGNITNIVLNDYDLDDGLDSSSVEIITPVGNGSFAIDENGYITYIPDYCYFGTDFFTYVIYDTYGNVSNVATVYLVVTINPSIDADLDGASDLTEDLNQNGTPCDDDTDGDEIPNFLDDDDDGDGALSAFEDWNNSGDPSDDDTDGDGIPNYIDTDDDDDSVLSIDEDVDGNGNPLNDDTDGDGLPNFIDPNDDDDYWMTIDEVADLDQNGILDYLETWNVHAIDDNVNSGVEILVNIPVLVNDSSQFDQSTLYILTDPQNGLATIQNDFTIDYMPDNNFTGLDSFLYAICDYYNVCDTATVFINIEDILFFPELFTPNGDGINDYFVITGIEKYPDNHFEVYNRWGNKVYEADGYLNNWDGWANVRFVIGNNELPVGVYYYILRYNQTLDKAGALFLER